MTLRAIGLLGTLLLTPSCSEPQASLPEPYRDLEVPTDKLASADARARGRALYSSHCALCHGERADGRGRRRHSLSAPPADFTRPTWRQGTGPRELFYVIREGKQGSSMPAWKSLSEAQTWDLVAYLLSVASDA